MADTTRVIGVGNPDRGDDAIGPLVAARLSARADPGLEIVIATADPSRLIERWAGAETVVIVDAVVDDVDPGTIAVYDAGEESLPADAGSVSSHGFGVQGAIELARSLDRMPAHLFVVGVAGRRFDGLGLSPEVEEAVDRAVDTVMEVVSRA